MTSAGHNLRHRRINTIRSRRSFGNIAIRYHTDRSDPCSSTTASKIPFSSIKTRAASRMRLMIGNSWNRSHDISHRTAAFTGRNAIDRDLLRRLTR